MRSSTQTTVCFLISLVLSGCTSWFADDKPLRKTRDLFPVLEPANQKAFLLFGSKRLFLANIGTDSQFQVVMDVEWNADQDIRHLYELDRQRTGAIHYYMIPEPFSIPELLRSKDYPMRRSFRADLVRGHPKGHHSVIASDVMVLVNDMIVAQKVLKQIPSVVPRPKEYYVFGEYSELFAVRLRHEQNDPEEIMSIRVTDSDLSPVEAEDLLYGSRLTLQYAGSKNLVKTSYLYGGAPKDVHFRVLARLYQN